MALKIRVLLLIFTLSLFAKEPSFARSDMGNFTIFSEPNLAYVLTKIVRDYSKKTNNAISINFNSSSYLIDNIDLGEPADIFISSHPDWFTNLSQKGLIDRYNLATFAYDKIVLVTSRKNTKINLKDLEKIKDFDKIIDVIIKQNLPLIIDSQLSSAGKYGSKAISQSNIGKFQLFQKVAEDRKSVIDFITTNTDYFGIVMNSEGLNNDNVVILADLPNSKIEYQALVIAGDNMENARKFIEYLKDKKAQNILKESGFIITNFAK